MAELFIPDVEAIRDQMLSDLELGAIDAGVPEPPIQVGGDWYALATAEANLHAIGLQNLALAQRDTTPLEAEEPKLDEWRQAFGLPVVPATAARGRIILETTGGATVPGGAQLTHAKGTRYAVAVTTTGVANYDEVEVTCLDPGEEGNLDPGEVLQFVAPPVNVKTRAVVSETDPLVGGADGEDSERKRDRILNRTENAPGGGNWGQLRQIAIDASPAVQGAYPYPALGGPASTKVVLTKRFVPSRRDFSRVPSSTLVTLVRDAIQTNAADSLGVVVQAVAEQAVNVSLQVTIPDSVLTGGDGNGWLDAAPWPGLNGDNRVTVTGVASERMITVSALTTAFPTAGQTRIAWWSPVDLAFVTRLVTVIGGATGAWVLTLDAPLSSSDGSLVAIGDYICPAAANLAAYGNTWRSVLEKLGPGENTADTARLPRSLRHPLTSSQDSPSLNATQIRALLNKHAEIQDVAYSYRSSVAPSIPTTIAAAPFVLVPNHFGVYPL